MIKNIFNKIRFYGIFPISAALAALLFCSFDLMLSNNEKYLSFVDEVINILKSIKERKEGK